MNRRPKQFLVVFLTMFLAALIISGGWAESAVAQDEVNPGGQSNEDVIPLAQSSHLCTIGDIFASVNRIHVRCTNAAPNGVYWFAAANDPDHIRVTNQFLTLLNTAFALDKQVSVAYESSSVSNPSGCATTDCRMIYGISITK